MKRFILRLFSVMVLGMGASFTLFAQDYIAIAKNGNVYDEANTKYITVNQNNDDVAVVTGMVFATNQHTPGWYKVEYSPGLHAFIPDQIAASSFKSVKPGTYQIKNNPGQSLTAQQAGDEWTANVNGKSYKGKKVQEIVLFFDNGNQPAFSIVDLGSGPIAISYDNAVTKFF